MFLTDCTRGKNSQIFIVFILIYLFEKILKIRSSYFANIFFHYSETCQHISLITGFKRKNDIFGLKFVETYMAVMGEINLPLIFLWDLTHSIREYFEKLAFKKKTNNESLNGCISKARANSESKLTCSESSFNFLQKSVVVAWSTRAGTRQGLRPSLNPRSRAQRVRFNIWKKYLTCQHYIHVCSFYTQKAKLTTLLSNYWLVVYLFTMNMWPQIKLFYGTFADFIVILRRVHL